MKTVLTLLKHIAVILAGFLFVVALGLLKLLYFGAVIFIGYHSILIGWLMLIPPCLLVIWVWVGAILDRPADIPEISPEANKLLRKCYPHYSLPNTFRTYAHIAILSWMSGLVLAVFGCFRGSWWGIPLAIAAFAAMATIANRFNPKYWLRSFEDQDAHHEIIEHFRQEDYTIQHGVKTFLEREAARKGEPASLFGTKWFMSMNDVRRALPYAEPSIDDANDLYHPGRFDGRKVAFLYHFENDSLTKISVHFQGFGSTVQDFHRAQTQLSTDYCQMSPPSASDMYTHFSRGAAKAFCIEHFLWNRDENQNGEGIIFLPPSANQSTKTAQFVTL